jgi:hypothetical protein
MSRRLLQDAASDAEDSGGLVRRCVPASFEASLWRVAPHRAQGRSLHSPPPRSPPSRLPPSLFEKVSAYAGTGAPRARTPKRPNRHRPARSPHAHDLTGAFPV